MITKKDISLEIKKANKTHSLDLSVNYIEGKPRIYRKSKPKVYLSPIGLSMNNTFYWLDAWLEGYSTCRNEDKIWPGQTPNQVPAIEIKK